MKDSISDNRIWSEVIDLLPVWTWETDGDYRLTYINLQGLVVPGLRTDDFIGLSILEGYQQYTNEPGLGTYMKALRDKKTIQNLCYERVLVNNERAVLMDTAVPRYGENGQFMGYRGVSFNLTETLKNAEDKDSLVGALQNRNRALEEQLSRRNEEIKASNHLLRGILDAMGEGVLVTSGDDISDPDK
jgi:PAS domain-containing protein